MRTIEYGKGWDAYWSNKKTCPYLEGSRPYNEWWRGYLDAAWDDDRYPLEYDY